MQQVWISYMYIYFAYWKHIYTNNITKPTTYQDLKTPSRLFTLQTFMV